MALSSVSNVGKKLEKRSGLAGTLDATRVCQYVDSLFPGKIKAISIKNGYLKVGFQAENRMLAELNRGDILRKAQAFATEKNLPIPTEIRLTETVELC